MGRWALGGNDLRAGQSDRGTRLQGPRKETIVGLWVYRFYGRMSK